MQIIREFRDFALRGNVIDMAVGIIIGAAFGKIVDSLVKDVLMPPLGWVLGGVDFSNLEIIIQPATDTMPAIAVRYGVFLNSIISFVIVAFAMFFLIHLMKTMDKRKVAASPVPPSSEEILLREIRDILKAKA